MDDPWVFLVFLLPVIMGYIGHRVDLSLNPARHYSQWKSKYPIPITDLREARRRGKA